MNALNEFSDNMTDGFIKFWKENYLLVLIPFTLALFVHSFDIFNHFLSLDELHFYQFENEVTTDLHVQRWFLVAENLIFGLINQPVAQILALFLMAVSAAIISTVVFKEFKYKFLFSVLFTVCPIFGSTMMISYIGANIAFAVFLTAMCFKYFATSIKKKYTVIIIGLVLALVIGTYQSLLSVFITLLVFNSIIRYFENKTDVKSILKNLFFGALCCLIAVVIHYTVLFILDIQMSEYAAKFTGKGDTLTEILGSYFTHTYRMLIGIRIWPPITRVATAAFILFLLHCFIKRKNFGINLLLMFAFLIASILHNIIIGGFSPVRSQLALHIFFAGTITLWFMAASKPEKLFIYAATGVIILLSANYMSKLYMDDFYARKYENMLATHIVENIFKVAPETFTQKTKIMVIGTVPTSNQTVLFETNDMFGYKHTDVGIMYYIYSMGFPNNFEWGGEKRIYQKIL